MTWDEIIPENNILKNVNIYQPTKRLGTFAHMVVNERKRFREIVQHQCREIKRLEELLKEEREKNGNTKKKRSPSK